MYSFVWLYIFGLVWLIFVSLANVTFESRYIKIKMASDKHVLTPNERRLILKVEEYFKKEKENGGPLLSTVAVQQRTADSCGISRRTLVNIHNLEKDGDIEKKNKKRRLSLKTKDLPEGVKCQIRGVIYDMYKQKEVVTLESTLEKIRSR